MQNLIGWFAGKKTYILSVLLVLVTVALIALGKLTPETAFAVLMFFSAAFAASFRSALQRHSKEVVQLLTEGGALGRDLATKNIKDAELVGVALAATGQQLASEIQAEKGQVSNEPTA